MFDNIDPEGEFRVLDPPGQAPGPAAPAAPVIAPAPVQADILLNAHLHVSNEEGLEDAPEDGVEDEGDAPEYETDDDSLEDSEVHAHVQDVRVGPETLVMNTALVTITTVHLTDAEVQRADVQADQLQETLVVNDTQATIPPDQLESSEPEVHSMPDQTANILQQINTAGTDAKFIATAGPFLASAQPADTATPTPMAVYTGEKLVESVLEAVQTPARVLEEADGESVEGPALKRKAVEKDTRADLTNQAGPSSSDCSDNV